MIENILIFKSGEISTPLKFFSLLFMAIGLMIAMSVTVSSTKLGVIVPLFSNYTESKDWETLRSVKKAHPNLQIIAIVNPASGVGSSIDSGIGSGTKSLQSEGIKVVGYIPTGYTQRDPNEVKNDIEKYIEWYGVDGIYFDEVANSAEGEDYYRDVVGHARDLKLDIAVGNPGTDTTPGYAKIFDILQVYEGEDIPPEYQLNESYSRHKKDNFAFFAFGVNSVNSESVKNLSKDVGWIYMTDHNLPNPWVGLPNYFGDFVKTVDDIQ